MNMSNNIESEAVEDPRVTARREAVKSWVWAGLEHDTTVKLMLTTGVNIYDYSQKSVEIEGKFLSLRQDIPFLILHSQFNLIPLLNLLRSISLLALPNTDFKNFKTQVHRSRYCTESFHNLISKNEHPFVTDDLSQEGCVGQIHNNLPNFKKASVNISDKLRFFEVVNEMFEMTFDTNGIQTFGLPTTLIYSRHELAVETLPIVCLAVLLMIPDDDVGLFIDACIDLFKLLKEEEC